MGMPEPDHRRRWTREEVVALIDEERAWPRYELIAGELLVTSAPRWSHQRAVFRLARILQDYVEPRRLGWVLMSPADIQLEPGSVVQPDVFVVPRGDGSAPREWSEVTRLLLAAEVLSPSNARADRVVKRRYYRRNAVPEYWIVDTDARVVERWTPEAAGPLVLDEQLVWQPAGADAPLVIDLPAYFRGVFDEPADGPRAE
jgi:Uma2 family endonuclease